MPSFRTTATVSDDRTLVLPDVPFQPGEQLDIVLNPHRTASAAADGQATHGPEDDSEASDADLDAWYQRLQELGPARFAPGELEEFQKTLDESKALSKLLVRRSMGRS